MNRINFNANAPQPRILARGSNEKTAVSAAQVKEHVVLTQ
jgi:hypothetical protein